MEIGNPASPAFLFTQKRQFCLNNKKKGFAMAKHEEDGNDWSDMKKYGPDSDNYIYMGDVRYFDWYGSVGGDGDKVAYAQFSFTGPLKLSFKLCSDDEDARNFKITIYKLTGKPGKYSLKALQTTTTKKRTVTDEYYGYKYTEYSATSKAYLFKKGADTESTYYIAVRPTNAKYETSFSISLNTEKSCFYEQAQNGTEDNWSDMKKKGAASEVTDFDSYYSFDLNSYSYDSCLIEDWVGMGDAVDYRRFKLSDTAKVSLSLQSSAGNVQISIFSLKKKGKNYTLKSLASSKVKKKQITYDDDFYDEYYYESSSYNYSATTKSVLLQEGNYYICVKSTNASKGGSADYEVSLNASGSCFYEEAETGYVDDWTDMKEMGAASDELEDGAFDPSSDWGTFESGWVGMGDSVDYRRLTISTPVNLSLDVYATDTMKFTIYELTGSEGDYSLKKLQSTDIKKKKSYPIYNYNDERTYTFVATTKQLLLNSGDYYMCYESTNAKKGGSAYYGVDVNASSTFFSDADDGWNDRLLDKWHALAEDFYRIEMNSANFSYYDDNECHLDTNYIENYVYLGDSGEWSYRNYVGYGDEADYQAIVLEEGTELNFTIQATSDKVKFAIYQLLDTAGNGENYTKKTLQTTTLSKKTMTYTYEEEKYNSRDDDWDYVTKKGKYTYYGATSKTITLDAGTYYIAMHATDPSKPEGIYYNVFFNNLSNYYDDDDYYDYDYCALTGPEACVSDIPGMQDELAAGLACGDALAGASMPSALPDVQEDCGLLLQNGGLLA